MKNKDDQLKQAHTHTHAQRHACTLTLCLTHTLTHTTGGEKKNVSRINTGKVQHVHVIYPKFMKTEQNEGRDHTGFKMEKHAEVHCSTVASLLADYKIGRKTERERKKG